MHSMWITLFISFLSRTDSTYLRVCAEGNVQEFLCSLESNNLTECTEHSSDILGSFLFFFVLLCFCEPGERNLGDGSIHALMSSLDENFGEISVVITEMIQDIRNCYRVLSDKKFKF